MSIRLFVAIELPEEQRRRLARIQDSLKRTLPSVRWVRPANIHLTLKFLGDMPERDLPRVKEIVSECARGIPQLRICLVGIDAFPGPQSPRVIWVGVKEESGGLRQIAQRLENLFEGMGVEKENRSFNPHLTLGRVKERGRESAYATVLPRHKDEEAGDMMAGEISLVRSDLSPEGPTYTTIHTARLG